MVSCAATVRLPEGSEPHGRHIMKGLAAGPDGRSRQRERKVRTPQSSVPDNVREAGWLGSITHSFGGVGPKPGRRRVPQKTYRPAVVLRPMLDTVLEPRGQNDGGVRVKRCGKSAPPPQ
jgi:hypothetical protein